MKQKFSMCRLILSGILVAVLVSGYFLYRKFATDSRRSVRVLAWLRNPEAHTDWAVRVGQRCGDAPFILPTDGFVGYLWDDSFRVNHRHQGIDIFGGKAPGITEVRTAYAGYLTRLPDWKSSLIIRIPQDPLYPAQQIWTYYTHLADSNGNSFIISDFPPGSSEIYVEAGTLLGYQGNYSGAPGNPTGVHLHFSIVLDDPSNPGHFLNELEIKNTLDPSPYFGLPLNANTNKDVIPVCSNTP
ncbi:MAG: hypothetical protein JW908_02930 [Anaerolineales bacterium]|nr:hypothetical protein [Anaerolineales bacterium]